MTIRDEGTSRWLVLRATLVVMGLTAAVWVYPTTHPLPVRHGYSRKNNMQRDAFDEVTERRVILPI
jgi:hypothetical protein